MTRPGRYPVEIRERAVRLVLEHQGEYPSQWAAISSIATKCGMTPETLRKWVRRGGGGGGGRAGRPDGGPPRPARPTSRPARQRPPSAGRQRDEALKLELQQAHAEHFGVYGARKLWRQLQRQGTLVARCTVERLMRELGLAGVVRGRHHRTTVSDEVSPRPADLVERDFRAAVPNRLGASGWPGTSPGPRRAVPPDPLHGAVGGGGGGDLGRQPRRLV